MSTRNPLIADDDTHQTLHNVSCVISYLQVVRPVEGELDSDTEYGLWLLQEGICDALDHEKERVLKQHVKAAQDA